MSLQVAVVGGSIAGCCAAIELVRIGHRVEVFERSSSALVGQGAAIGLLPDTLNALLRHDLIDEMMPRLPMREHVLLAKSVDHELMGRASLRVPTQSWSVNWSHLHSNLRKRVPDHAYRAGIGVRGVAEARCDSVDLVLSDGSQRRFDLVVFADGHASIGRPIVCPEVEPAYRGYVLWRGVVEASALVDAAPLDATIYRISYRGARGHAIAYRMPSGRAAPLDAGLVNFGCYRAVSADALPAMLVDRHGRQRAASLPAGALRPEEELRFKVFAKEQLPRYFGDLMAQSCNTFVQPIFSARVPRQRFGRICLLGDAAALVAPLTGSGVMKAAVHALGLARQLQSERDLDAALTAWDAQQSAFGRVLSDLGEQMESAFLWNTPDFGTLDPAGALRWWQTATSLPQPT